MKRLPRKRKAVTAPHRPVLSVRLDAEVYAEIAAEAEALNVSLTEVVYRRLMQCYAPQQRPEPRRGGIVL